MRGVYPPLMRRAAFLLLLLLTPTVQAQIDLPILDSDNFQHGLNGPSMEQSTAATAAFYEEVHFALQRAWGKRERLGKVTVAVFDVVEAGGILPLPLGDAWLHEEYHRAVMSSRGIGSFNEVYRFQLSPDAISVSHVRDEDLIRLKSEHPADLVRLGEAGIEGELMLVQRLEKDRFFRGSKGYHLPLYWLAKLATQGYVASGTDSSIDEDTQRWEAEEGTSIRRRDFTGHDFTGWAYDLFRPDEPYAARGIHPSGVGIRRYRRTTDLTPEERAWIDRQGRRMLLNFLDPNLVGIDGFTWRGTTMNVTAGHFLTSFGSSSDANAFLSRGGHRLFVIAHRYENGERTFAGIDAELLDEPLTVAGRRVEVTPRVALWIQPEHQRFRDGNSKPGGLAALRVRYRRAFVDLEAKSAGWVAGNAHLDGNVGVRVGVVVPLPH